MEQQKKWLTSKGVADIIGVTVATVGTWARKGLIPCYRFNSRYFFDEQEVREWMKQKRKGDVESDG